MNDQRRPQIGNQFYLNNILGLSEAEAAQRLKKEGYNGIPSTKRVALLPLVYHPATYNYLAGQSQQWLCLFVCFCCKSSNSLFTNIVH
jgi:hypothetical protein